MKNQTRHYYEAMQDWPLDDVIAKLDSYFGYEREAALLIAIKSKEISLLPAYIVRANDWVKGISTVARNAITNLLIPENIETIIRYLPDIFHLEKCRRYSHDNLLKMVSNYLLQPEVRPYLFNAVSARNIKLATIAFDLVVDNNLQSTRDNIFLGLKNKGIIIAKKSLQMATELSDDEFLEISHLFINHRSSYVVSKALKRLIRIEASLLDHQLDELLFHHSEEIRTFAQQRMTDLGKDPAAIYLDVINFENFSHHQKAKAITGISEVKKLDCLPFAKQMMENENNGQLYKVLIETILKLLKDDAKPLLLTYLIDKPLTEPTLNSIAKLCRQYYIAYSWTELTEISNGQNNHLEFLFKLSKTGSKWTRLVFYLHLANENKYQHELLNPLFSYWIYTFTRQQIGPTKTEQEEILRLIQATAHKLSVGYEKQIQFLAKSFL